MKLKFTLFLIPLLLFSGGCADRKNEKPKVVFILPEGFRGVFKVVQNNQGKMVASDSGTIFIIVPSDGIVSLKNREFLYDWHGIEAKFISGEMLYNADASEPKENETAFFSLWAESDNGPIFYLVGSKKDYEAARKAGPWKIESFLPAN